MKNVLIVSSTGMGDCLWGTPGIRALKKTFPEMEIYLVVNPNWKSLFEVNNLRKILFYGFKNIHSLRHSIKHFHSLYIGQSEQGHHSIFF